MLWLLIVCILSICASALLQPEPIYPIIPAVLEGIENEVCRGDFNRMAQAIENNTFWAYSIWDASAKTEVGIIEGFNYELGHYDQCLKNKEPFLTQYCLTKIIVKKTNKSHEDPTAWPDDPYGSVYNKIFDNSDPTKTPRNHIYRGLCLPISCPAEDIQTALQQYLDDKFRDAYEIHVAENNCQTANSERFTIWDFSFCATLACVFLITVICTLFHKLYLKNNLKNGMANLAMCFSLEQNVSDLNRKAQTNDALYPINFIRSTLMYMIVCIHGNMLDKSGPLYNTGDAEKDNSSAFFIIRRRGDVVIDTFFCMGGMLATYNFMVQSEKKNMNILKLTIVRYFRLIPLFSLISFFYATIYGKLGSGPLWNEFVGVEQQYCQENWWTNMLTVNNYINSQRMCIIQGWYIPCDFHFFIASLILNMMIKYNKKIGFSILACVFGVTMLVPFFVVYYSQFRAFIPLNNNSFLNLRSQPDLYELYVPTHMRGSSYIIGMLFGHFYYKIKDSDYKMSKITSTILVFVGMAIGLTCVCTGLFFYAPYEPYSQLNSAFYVTIHRPLFAFASGLGIFVLSYGYIPIISSMSRWTIWSPLAKLSYGVYMTHLGIQLFRLGLSRNSYTHSLFRTMNNTSMDVLLSTTLAYLFFLTFENPISKFARILSTKENTKKQVAAQNVSSEVLVNEK